MSSCFPCKSHVFGAVFWSWLILGGLAMSNWREGDMQRSTWKTKHVSLPVAKSWPWELGLHLWKSVAEIITASLLAGLGRGRSWGLACPQTLLTLNQLKDASRVHLRRKAFHQLWWEGVFWQNQKVLQSHGKWWNAWRRKGYFKVSIRPLEKYFGLCSMMSNSRFSITSINDCKDTNFLSYNM